MAIITANKDALRSKSVPSVRSPVRHVTIVAALLTSIFSLLSNSTFASDWKIEPSLRVASIFSDNIDLEPNGDSDLALEVSPAVHISRESRRLNVNLDYSLQNLKFIDDSDLDTSNHLLSAFVNAEAIADILFVDFSSSISQQLVDRRSSGSSDAIIGSSNFSDVYSYSVSPYLQQRVGNIADFELRYTYDMVSSDDFGSDSDGNAVSFDIANGPASGKFNWNARFNNNQVSYDDGDKSDTESGSARIGYQQTRQFNTFVSGSYENNEFVGDRGDSEPDDSFVGAGFTWAPSQDFNLTFIYNERLDPRPNEDDTFVSGDIFWAPTARTSLNLGLENNFFGEAYNGNISHRTRWTLWNFSYEEGVSDFRSQFLEQGRIVCPPTATSIAQCRTLAPGESPQPGEVFLGNNNTGFATGFNVSITEDTFINKTGRASVSVVGAKNTVTLSATDTRRRFVADNDTEQDSSLDLSWNHQFSPLTDSLITVGRSQEQFDDDQEDDFMRYVWRVTRQIGGDSIFYVEAQVSERDAEVSSRSYDENRLTISFEKFF